MTTIRIFTLLLLAAHLSDSLSLLSPPSSSASTSKSLTRDLLDLISNVKGRGNRDTLETNQAIIDKIEQLESLSMKQLKSRSKERIQPINSKLIDGTWKLIFTSSPGTNSPIQKAFTSEDSFSVYQVVNLIDTKSSFLQKEGLPDISNVICFNDKCRLRVTAIASTANTKLVEPRKSDGKIFGLNVFGVSKAQEPRSLDERIDFAFQEASFEFLNSSFAIPYPVPFKLLGDEAKGWIDNTYLGNDIRISRGNKGTIFVLKKADDDDFSARFASTSADDVKRGIVAPRPVVDGKATPNTKPKSAWSLFSSSNGRLKAPSTAQKCVIILPAQLGIEEDYEELIQNIQESLPSKSSDKIKFYTTPLKRLDWVLGLLPSALSKDYFAGTLKPKTTLDFYFKKIEQSIERAIMDNRGEDVEITIIAHSIGGWVIRAFLTECASEETRRSIKKVISLGTPHNQPPTGSLFEKVDQTRGLLTHINSNYPGSFYNDIEYISVVSSKIKGELQLQDRSALLAYVSYSALCGDGTVVGDGIVPVGTSTLAGSVIIDCGDAYHSNYVPTPLQSIVDREILWYGSKGEILNQWIKYI